ncbi:MAG: hypothetical protein Q7R51_02585 [bacterium]|nr:hypothetical protein [bacterium]
MLGEKSPMPQLEERFKSATRNVVALLRAGEQAHNSVIVAKNIPGDEWITIDGRGSWYIGGRLTDGESVEMGVYSGINEALSIYATITDPAYKFFFAMGKREEREEYMRTNRKELLLGLSGALEKAGQKLPAPKRIIFGNPLGF